MADFKYGAVTISGIGVYRSMHRRAILTTPADTPSSVDGRSISELNDDEWPETRPGDRTTRSFSRFIDERARRVVSRVKVTQGESIEANARAERIAALLLRVIHIDG